MKIEPKSIKTNQIDMHPDTLSIVKKYKTSSFCKPIAAHTQSAFESTLSWLGDWRGDVIIDACCGVGESTSILAARHPTAKIIGIDKSAARLSKHSHYDNKIGLQTTIIESDCDARSQHNNRSNHIVVQADLNDFWRLLADAKKNVDWSIKKQYLLYPNPYPKKSQVQKRWHTSPAFSAVLGCCNELEVRSNWLIYLQEFQAALAVYDIQSSVKLVTSEPITPFERKYTQSGQSCWALNTNN